MSKILIVCGAGIVSGKEIMALELGSGLVEHGEAVSFITSCWNNGDFPARLERSEFPTYILPIGFISATLTRRCLAMTFEQIRRWPGLLWSYSRLLRRLKPRKVVHTNWHHLLLLMPFLRPQRDLFWLHEVVPNLLQYRCVFRFLAHGVGSFICVSQAVATSLERIGIRDDKIRVIHNGLTDPSSSACCVSPRSRTFRIGIVGQINPSKGHDDLLDAFALLAPKHAASELHIFGGGSPAYRSDLRQRSIELGVAERVVWHDFVPDRGTIYSGLDVCVVPSRSPDPFPTTALEAGFFSLPTVATRRGGLPEIISHEVNGLIVEAERPQEIAHALSRLIEEPDLHQRLSANARKRAVEHFGRERFISEFAALLKDGVHRVQPESAIA